MPRGGWRPGAGRKKGSGERRKRTTAERLTAAAKRAIAASKDAAVTPEPAAPPILVSLTATVEAALPLDVMITAMRAHLALARKDEQVIDLREMDKAAAIAKDAAPYIHPRLVSSPGGGEKETVVVIRGGLGEPPRSDNAD